MRSESVINSSVPDWGRIQNPEFRIRTGCRSASGAFPLEHYLSSLQGTKRIFRYSLFPISRWKSNRGFTHYAPQSESKDLMHHGTTGGVFHRNSRRIHHGGKSRG